MQTLQAVQLVGGDPLLGRSTFTRFILPFSWSLSPCTEAKSGPAFREAAAQDWIHAATAAGVNPESVSSPKFLDWARRRYLTEETDGLLFKRAKWFILDEEQSDGVWKKMTVESNVGVSYDVFLRPPALVLFEMSKALSCTGTDSVFQTGFLLHEAFFNRDKPPSYFNLLRFNEIFRYIRCPFRDHAVSLSASELTSMAREATGTTARSELTDWKPDQLDSLYNWRWEKLFSHSVLIQETEYQLRACETKNEDEARIFPSWLVNPDDRAFTATFAVLDNQTRSQNDKGPGELIARSFTAGVSLSKTGPEGFWVKLLNVDRPKPGDADTLGDASLFEIAWANERTYKRWAEGSDCTLYGYCEHAAAVLTQATRGDGRQVPVHGEPELSLHFGQMYFDVTLLLLYVRVSLFRFSRWLSGISSDARDGKQDYKEWKRSFDQLHQDFMLFENLYQWPLLSNQQQHLEMYEIQRRSLDIEDLYEEVRREIESSDELLDREADEELAEAANRLNWLAACGLVLSLVLGGAQIYYGSQTPHPPGNFPQWNFLNDPAASYWWASTLTLLSILVGLFFIFWNIAAKIRRRQRLKQ